MDHNSNKSRTMMAMSLVDDGVAVQKAANAMGISRAAVYAAMKRRQGKPICPTCHQIVRDGFSISKRRES